MADKQVKQAKDTKEQTSKAEVNEKKNETTKTEQDKETKKWSSIVTELGDKIVGLTLMQAKELGDYLKEKYGIEPAVAASGAMVTAGPAAPAQAEEKEEKTTFDVILKEFGDKKIQVIKEVRALTGLGLKEAKALVDEAPTPIKQKIKKEEAEEIKVKLEELGASVEIK